MTDRLSDAQLAELKDRHPCQAVAARYVALRQAGRRMIGPCPVCSADRQSKTSTRFECDAEGWVCAVCPDGGDVIKLVQKIEGLDFRAAVEHLGGAATIDAERAAALERVAKAKADKRARDSAWYREQERRQSAAIYGDAHPAIAGSDAAEYLKRRHLDELPRGAKLRSLSQLAYFERIGTPSRSEAIARAPAMVAGIVDAAGRFAGVHMTYLDPARGNGKLALAHPETGEGLPAKKVRGSKAGGHIELAPCAQPHTLVIGEGIETVLSAWRAFVEASRPIEGVAFWAAVDLGNLGGRARETVPHSSLKTPKGRPQRVPGPDPDPASPAIAIPDSVTRVIILGDGDSDPLLTQCAVWRASVRFSTATRQVVVAWAPPGMDFNDLAPDWPRILELIDAATGAVRPEIDAPASEASARRGASTNGARRKPRGRSVSFSSSQGDSNALGSAVSESDDQKKVADAAPRALVVDEKNGAILANDDAGDRIDEAVIVLCSLLDQSDTDNGERLRHYFGENLTVMAQSGVPTGGQYLAWTGTHWDIDGGNSKATIIAQRVGELIKAEADVMAATPLERKALDAAAAARAELNTIDAADESEAAKARKAELEGVVGDGLKARAALNGRKKERRKFAIASKNVGKIEAMLKSLSHHLRRPPDDFNTDAMLVATRSHTLTFRRCPGGPGAFEAALEAAPSHRRADLITALIPLDYDPAATCPKFLANMARFQPDAAQRRTVQQFAGLGLLGAPIQRIMFHYGTGGNFKSVFLEVITRVLGDSFAIGLPAESISGKDDRGPGQAAPDLERVFGKRMLRVLELPDGQPLQAGTIKKLTGGEKWPVRTLYKGYYEFQPRAKTHMSGNSLPHFDGSDGGMRRRLLIVEWPVTIAENEQRDFEEVVTELMAEAQGILNWLVAGALDYLQHGLVVAPSIAALTAEQIEEMDPIGHFFRDCVEPDPGGPGVQARTMYRAYRHWSEANAKRIRSENKFGREMKKLCSRDDSGRVRVYVDVRLHDVPAGNEDDDRARNARGYRAEGPQDDDAPIM